MIKNETQTKPNNLLKIMIIVLAVIMFTIIGVTIINNKNNKLETEEKIAELKEEKITLSAKKNEEFKNNGFTEEYYRLQQELTDVQKELSRLELNSDTSFIFIPIIMVSLVAFGIIFIVFTNVISGFRRTHDTFDLVHDVIRTRLQEQQLHNTKIDSVKCPSCKASMDPNATECEYCGTKVTRVRK